VLQAVAFQREGEQAEAMRATLCYTRYIDKKQSPDAGCTGFADGVSASDSLLGAASPTGVIGGS